MPIMNLEPLSGAELRALGRAVERELAKRQRADLKRVAGHIRALATQHGLTLADVLRHGPGGKSPARYQHPLDAAITWTGKGKRPGWVKDWLAQGNALADLLIAPPAATPSPANASVSGATDEPTPRAAPVARPRKRQGASAKKPRRPASGARRGAPAKGL